MTDVLTPLRARLRSPDAEERRLAVAELPGGLADGVLEILVQTLADVDWRVRKEAVGRVARWPDASAAVDALIAVVRAEDDVGWRNASLDALAHIGKQAVAPVLAEVQRGGEHRKFLVDTLGAIGEAEAAPILIRLLSDDDPNLRVASAEALRQIGGGDAKAALRGCLAVDDLPLRLAAIEGLAILQAEVAVAEVRPSLEDSVLRKSALRLLGWSRDPSAVPHLVDALRQARRSLHAAATQSIANLLVTTEGEDRDDVLRLVGGLGDDARRSAVAVFASDDAGLRRAAASVLGAAGAVEFAAALAEGMADPSVGEACAHALGELGADAVPPILSVAAGAEPELRADLYHLLGTLGHGGAEVEAVLIEALDDDELVAAAAARALGAVATGGPADALEGALVDIERPELAAAAATALGQLVRRGVATDPDAVVRVLGERGLLSRLAEVRAAAALALGAAGASAHIGDIAAQLTDDEPFAQLAAIRALAELGAPGRALLLARLDQENDAEMASAIRAALAEVDVAPHRDPDER